MASIGTLVGFLRLDDSQYSRALKANETATKSFAASAASAMRRFIVPAAAAGSIIAIGKRAFDAAERFDVLSRRVGASFEGIQVLGNIAKNSGLEAESFTGAIDKLNHGLAEASTGSLEAIKPFHGLGLAIADFTGLNAERKMELLAKAVAGAGDKQEAFLYVSEILGTKAGPELAATLEQLAGGYDRLAAAQQSGGQIMPETTGKALAKAKRDLTELNDQLTIVAGWYAGLFLRGVNATSGAVADVILPTAPGNISPEGALLDDVHPQLALIKTEQDRVRVLGLLQQRLDELQQTQNENAQLDLDRTIPITRAQIEQERELAAAVKRVQDYIDALSNSQTANQVIANNSAVATAALTAEFAGLDQQLDSARARFAELVKASIPALTREFEKLDEQLDGARYKNAADALKDISDVATDAKTPLERFREEMVGLNAAIKTGQISWAAYALSARDAREALGSSVLGEVERGADILRAGGTRAGNSTASRIDSYITKSRAAAARGTPESMKQSEWLFSQAGKLAKSSGMSLEDTLGAAAGAGGSTTPSGVSPDVEVLTEDVRQLVEMMKVIGSILTVS